MFPSRPVGRLPAVAFLLLLAAPAARSTTIRVPADQPTIAAALAAAVAGDEVVVDCGTYPEYHLQIPSGVTLRSATGDPDCVIVSASRNYLARIDAASDVLVQGFTFTSDRARALLVLQSSGVRIESCDFKDCTTPTGGTLDIQDSDVGVTACRFLDNEMRSYSADIVRADGAVNVADCQFRFNGAMAGYGTVALAFSGRGPHTLRATTFDDAFGGCVGSSGCDVLVEDSRFRKGQTGPNSPPLIGSAYGGSLVFRNCIAESTGRDAAWVEPSTLLEAIGGATLVVESFDFIDPLAQVCIVGGTNGYIRVERSIVSNATAPSVFRCTGGSLSVVCSDLYAPAGAAFGGPCAPDTAQVFDANPQFCDAAAGDYHLSNASPCRAQASPCGQLIGAFDVGCGDVGVEPWTWSRVKALYR